MADQVVEEWRVTADFIKLLENGTGKTVYDGEIPPNAKLPTVDVDGVAVPEPYFIVYEIPGGHLDGSWGAPNEEATIQYQVTSVGRVSRRQARAAADLARRTIIQRADKTALNDGYAVAWPGGPAPVYSVVCRVLEDRGGTQPSGTETNHPFTVAERFTVKVNPS